MAAQLHLKQAHGGNGTIEAGPGPGQAAAAAATPAAAASPAHGAARGMAGDDEEYRPVRRQRPTPQPLNKSILEMPPGHMEALLEVWDSFGRARIPDFVPSTAVAKVYAAKPVTAEDALPTYASLATGDAPNPFEQTDEAEAKSTGDENAETSEAQTSASELSWCKFRATAAKFWSPLRPAKVRNPFETAAVQALPGPAAVRAATAKAATGEQQPETATTSPFAAAASAGEPASPPPPSIDSPFAAAAQAASAVGTAGQAASPFGSPGQAASPFAAAASSQAASPFAAAGAAASSPFAAAGAASPFAAAGQAATPFGAAADAPSPFAAAGGASPFAAAGQSSGSPFAAQGAEFMGFMGQAAPVQEESHKCPHCDRVCKSKRALAAHAKAKHNVTIELGEEDRRRRRAKPMDLPPYVPSPVDLTQTSPFGGGGSEQRASWSEVELYPTATMVSNMDVVGRVASVERGMLPGTETKVTQIVVSLVDDDTGAVEELVVRAFGPVADVAAEELSAGCTVAASGMLRLNPFHEPSSNRYLYAPALHVSAATGALHRVD